MNRESDIFLEEVKKAATSINKNIKYSPEKKIAIFKEVVLNLLESAEMQIEDFGKEF